jgi:hypothetical protein
MVEIGGCAMKAGKFFIDFLVIFVIVFLVSSVVTYLYSLIVHGDGNVDWSS